VKIAASGNRVFAAEPVFGGVDAELEADGELGGEVALEPPEVLPYFDADDVDADDTGVEDGVNDAKERLVGVDAAAQNCSTKASAEATSEGQVVRHPKKAVV